MKHPKTFGPLVAVATAAVLFVSSATGAEKLNVKLGLWEITTLTRISGMPPIPKDVLDKMTPESRAKMMADLKKNQDDEPEPDVSSECITQDDLDKPFQSADSENCTQTIVRTTKTTQEIRLVCTGKTKGSGVFRVTTPSSDTMHGDLELRVGDGPEPMLIKSSMKGRWLGADCGDEDDGHGDEDEDENSPQ